MPDPEELKQFHDIAEEIKALGVDTQQYKEFERAISDTDRLFTELSRKKGSRIPAVSERGRRQLLGAHMMIAQASENLLSTELSQELRDKVVSLVNIASKNQRALKAYDPVKDPKSMPSLLEDARAVKVDTRGTELSESLGGVQSRRQPIIYIDDKGKKVAGVFTPKKVNHYWDDIKSVFTEEANDPRNNLSEEAKGMLTGFLDEYHKVFPQVVQQNRNVNAPPNQLNRKDFDLTTMLSGIEDPQTSTIKPAFLENAFRNAYPQLQGRNLNNVFGKGMMQRLSRKIDPKFTPIGIQVDSAGILEGSRVDSRNAAFAAAAELFGVSHLVPETVPMKLVGENGQEIEGTFMKKASGMDPHNLPVEAHDIRKDSMLDTNGKGYKDLADLQVLDFICGNVDRHGNNMFYKFDRNGKFCGVTAIDNDCSFGCLVPNGNKNVNQMIVPKNMKFISRSMYEKVKDMTPAQLRFALRGFGLSESELRCSVKRLDILQKELKKVPRTIQIVEDKDFKKFNQRTLNQLNAAGEKGDHANLFARAYNRIIHFPTLYMAQKDRFRDLEEGAVIGEYNRALPGSTDREIESADVLLENMDTVTKTGWWRFHKGTSPQFEAMRKSVRAYKEYQEAIRDKIRDAKSEERKNDPDAPIDAIVTEAELREMARLRKDMKEKADAYLSGKRNSRFNSYTNDRKYIARMVREFGQKGETVGEDEMQTLQKQTQRAREESDRRLAEQQKPKQQGPVAGL